ncbi:hypothetical protein [Arenibaculum sp.]|uniref:hypothetical protein n=1 Tax=Arenibaculum sp. TaxID=2865862 RepID=UPI002E12E563|nr:hypothetical protein [Arenibaculum sp.]
MILSPIDAETLPDALDTFGANLAGDPFARTAFARIRDSRRNARGGEERWRADALTLAASLGIETLDEEPRAAFSWDGRRIRTRSEPSVLIHEIAHWQLCPPERRELYDFGLGAGPETGRRADADAVAVASPEERQDEECLTSLLGILWEVELGQPGLLAFLEQNWLEGYRRPAAAEHFQRSVARLRAAGFLDPDGRPVRRARRAGEPL